jgi:O-antigen/teichoic acid export membrane protein
MEKSFWEDVIKYIPSKLIPAIAGFLSLVIFTRFLTPEEYGLYNLIMTTNNILIAIFIGWLSRASLRFFQKYKEEEKDDAFISYLYLFVIIIGLFVSLLYIFIINKVEIGFVSDNFLNLMSLGIWLILTKGLFELIINLNRAARNSMRYSLYQTIYSIGKILIVLFLFHTTNMRIEAVLVSYILSELVVIGIEYFLLKKRGFILNINFCKLTNVFFEKTARYGFPLVGVSLTALILSAGDKYLIQYFLGEDQVGLYSASYRIGRMSLHSIFMLLMLAAFPIIINQYERKGEAEAARVIKKYIGYYFLLLTPSFFGIWALSKEITMLVLGENYFSSFYILPLVSLGVYFQGLTMYINKVFELKEKTIYLFFIIGVSALLNILLNLFFIESYGIAGAAYSTVIAYLFYLIISYIFAIKIMRVLIPFATLFKSIIGSVVMLLTIMISKGFIFGEYSFYGFILNIVLGIITYLCVLYKLKDPYFNDVLNDIKELSIF